MNYISSFGKKPDSDLPLILKQEQLHAKDVAYQAWQVLLEHCEGLGGEDYAPLVKELPQHWRAVYTTFWLECEVENGGLHQFFWNSDGALNSETLEDLKYINANSFASVFEIALRIYGKHDYENEKKEHGNTWDSFTKAYREKRLEECDTRFYKQSEKQTIAEALSKHILENRYLYLSENAD